MRSRIQIALLFITMLIPWIGNADPGDNMKSTEYETPESAPMYCHSSLQISVNMNGYAVLLPQMMLAQTFPNYDNFVVSIINPPLGTDTVTCAQVGMTLDVMVTDTSTGNSCWSEVLVEDKLKPIITCDSVFLPCSVDPFNLPDSVKPSMLSDNCTDSADLSLTFSQSLSTLNCMTNPYVVKITRIWTVTDASNNSSSCTQIILIAKGDLSEVVFPPDITLSCPATNTDVSVTGEPTLFGQPVNQYVSTCMIVSTHMDNTLPKCGNSSVIQRTFTITSWCNAMTIMHTQNIHIVDTIPPVLYCPPNMTINAEMNCLANFVIPTINATDACADNASIQFTYKVDGVATGQMITGLTLGVHTIQVIGYDPCLNYDTCSFTVTVVDNLAPVLTCNNVNVTLNAMGMLVLRYDHFNHWYMDNCEILDTMIRRVNTHCDRPADLVFGDDIKFCCDDVGQDVMVEIKVTDKFGNMNSCMFMVNVKEGAGPVLQCPADMTIECTQVDDGIDFGSPIVTSGCPITLDSIEVINIDDCGRGEIIRTWTASSGTGCVQTITVINPFDFTADSVIYPADITITECMPDTSLAVTGEPTILDNLCGNISLSYNDSITMQGGCIVIYRLFEVFNACDSLAMFNGTQAITIKNGKPPVIIAPPNASFFVGPNCLAVVDLAPVVLDDCSTDITVTNDYNLEGGDINTAMFSPGVYTIRFTATNACGRSATDSTIITVTDNTPPVITCPGSVTLDCPADTSVANTGDATATDNCTNPPNITYSDVVTPGACPNTFSIVRTFVATDDAGNSASCQQNITVIDDTDPIISCPGNMTLNCIADTSTAVTGVATATEECNSPAVITYSDVVVPGSCPNTFTVTRTWTATDACGNAASCEQTIAVVDDTDPIISCPGNMTLNCPADTAVAVTGSATATDECNMNPTVTYTSNVIPGACPNTFTLERTWIAEDLCGNTSTCVQTITVIDDTDPIISCPGNMTLNCPADTAVANTGMATATEECNSPAIITYSDVVIPGACANTFTVNRTWLAMDVCGNSSSCVQVINVIDETDPIINCPGNVTLNCGDDTSPTNTGTATATDECNLNPVVSFADNIIPSGNCPNTFTIERTWTATDACGNTASCIQLIVVEDNIDPVITCPANVTLNCPADTSVANTGMATATDNCNNNPAISYADNVDPGNCPNNYTVTRTWTATDACGNTADCIQTITVRDITDPVITCPVDITIDCPGDTSTANTGSATAIDACGATNITYSDVVTPGSCPKNFSVVRTWIATDLCGNADTCMQNIVVEDVTDPVIICPVDVTIACNADTMPSMTGMATATDECNAAVTITRSDVVTPGSGNILFTITRTWKATDACGNMSTCIQTIVVTNGGASSLTCPDDITAYLTADSCQIFVDIPEPIVIAACGADITITNDGNGDDSLNASGIYPLGMTTITFTLMDGNGNDTSCQTIITVLDTISPTIDCPADVSIDCNMETSPLSQFGMPIFSDNCMNPTITTMDSTYLLDNCGVGTIERFFVVTDSSGNTASCTQTITVTGTSMLDSLDIIWPPAMVTSFECDFEDVPLVLPMIDPNITVCDQITVDSTVTQVIPATFGCQTFMIEYVVTDSCSYDPVTGEGQWIYNQIVGLFDTIPPVLNPITATGPYFADTLCMAEVNLSAITATDNCGNVTITNNSPFATSNGANASGTYPGGSTTVLFFAEDDCENIDTFSLDIFVTDTIKPDFVCIKIEINLPDSNLIRVLSAYEMGIAYSTLSDNCTVLEDMIITYTLNDPGDSLRIFDCDDQGLIMRFWMYAIDAQGNVDSCESEYGINTNVLCPTSQPIAIGGEVYTVMSESILDAEITLNNDQGTNVDMTDGAGEFMFEEILDNQFHRLDAEKDDPYLNGVTANDLSLLFRHIAGIELISDPYLYYAADVNGDRVIDIRDVLELRKLLLGVQDELPIPSWTFYDAAYDMSGVTNPFIHNVPEYVMVYQEQTDKMNSNFVGVKSGDLDFSATANITGGETRSSKTVEVVIGAPVIKQGIQMIPIFVDEQAALKGGQFQIELNENHQILEVITNAEMGLSDNEINQDLIHKNIVRMVWITDNELLDASQPICWIAVNSIEKIESPAWSLSENFYTEMFDGDRNKFKVDLKVTPDRVELSEESGFVLFQNVPNPFTHSTMIKFNLPQKSEYELSIYDVQGKQIHFIQNEGASGINHVELEQSVLNGQSGILYYQIKTENNNAVRKMIVE